MTTPAAVRHFLRDDDLSPAELIEVLDLADRLKRDPYAERPFAGPRSVAVLFDKTSTRTRFSFATGVADLGGAPIITEPGASQLGHKESVADTRRVLERMVAQVVWRTYAQSGLDEMAQDSRVPVINALSDDFHPCQLLADLQTIRERAGRLAGLTMSYFGDIAFNMGHSYALAGVNAGMHVRLSGPAGTGPKPEILADVRALAERTGGSIAIEHAPPPAAAGADVIVTDTWVSMGQSADDRAGVESPFAPYRVDEALMALAAPDAVFLHCLPAYRGAEVTAGVIDGPQSAVWDEAENRLHAQKALMVFLDRAARAAHPEAAR